MVFFGAMLDLTRKLKQAHHHRSIIHVNAYFNCEGNFHVGSLSGQQSSFFFFFFFALSRCKHCFPNLKGWGLRVFCQPGYPCLTVLRLQTAITGKFILFTLVIQRNINHSACTPTEQLYSSTYGDKSRTVSEIELTVTERLWIHLDTDIKKKKKSKEAEFLWRLDENGHFKQFLQPILHEAQTADALIQFGETNRVSLFAVLQMWLLLIKRLFTTRLRW